MRPETGERIEHLGHGYNRPLNGGIDLPLPTAFILTLALISMLQSQPITDTVKVVSRGEQFVLEKVLLPEKPTVFLFYMDSSSAEKSIAEQLRTKASAENRVGLRLIQLKSLDSVAARTYEILQTPTLMVLDRFGRLLVRTSNAEEIGPAVNKAMRMARLKWVVETDPEAATAYRMMGGGRSKVPEIMKTMSLRPDLMEGIMRVAQAGHFSNGYLPRKTKEMIATYVSAINHCKY
jgi:hypothetical protein